MACFDEDCLGAMTFWNKLRNLQQVRFFCQKPLFGTGIIGKPRESCSYNRMHEVFQCATSQQVINNKTKIILNFKFEEHHQLHCIVLYSHPPQKIPRIHHNITWSPPFPKISRHVSKARIKTVTVFIYRTASTRRSWRPVRISPREALHRRRVRRTRRCRRKRAASPCVAWRAPLLPICNKH